MENEEWKTITNFLKYELSDYGNKLNILEKISLFLDSDKFILFK